MAQSSHVLIFLSFMLGCTLVMVQAAPCTEEEAAKCSSHMAQLNDTTEGSPMMCSGSLVDDAIACWEALTCDLPPEMGSMMTMLKQTKEGCDAMKANATPQPTDGKTTTCDEAAVMKCEQQLASAAAPQVTKCMIMQEGAKCMAALTVNCPNKTTDASLKEMHAALEKNITDMKCCDVPDIQKCAEGVDPNYEITNATVSAEKCKEVSTVKMCVDKKLNACGDEASKKIFEAPLAKMTQNVETCKEEGYLGSGVTIQPALVLLLSSFLVTLFKLV